MVSAKYVARCVAVYVKRALGEDKRATLITTSLAVVLLPMTVSAFFKTLSRVPPSIAGLVGNAYAITFGCTMGFLASILASHIATVVRVDRVSRFIEVVLSTPLTPRGYAASIAAASTISGLAGFAVMAAVYTCVSLFAPTPIARSILLSASTYVIALLVAILTSLISVAISFLAPRVSIDPSRLSVLPSMAVFLAVVFVRSALSINALSQQALYAFEGGLGAACAALAIAVSLIARRVRGEHLVAL